jgi:hypothetical protein
MNKEINYLRNVEQLAEVNKRVLSKIFSTLRIVKMKRGHVVYKENETPLAAYIIKEGECEITKHVFDFKLKNADGGGGPGNEKVGLLRNPSLTKKFNANFARVQGLKSVGKVRVNSLDNLKIFIADDCRTREDGG